MVPRIDARGSWQHAGGFLDALALPAGERRVTACQAAAAEVGADLPGTLTAWSRIAGLPQMPGAGMPAARGNGPGGAWRPYLAALIDAGAAGDTDAIAAVILDAAVGLGDADRAVLAAELARVAAAVLEKAGGPGVLDDIASLQAQACPDHPRLPGLGRLLDPAALVAASVAFGHVAFAYDVTSRIYRGEPDTAPRTLAHIWLFFDRGMRILSDGWRESRVGWDGVPEEFVGAPAAPGDAPLEDITDLAQAGVSAPLPGGCLAALSEIDRLDRAGQAVLAWQLACHVGRQLSLHLFPQRSAANV